MRNLLNLKAGDSVIIRCLTTHKDVKRTIKRTTKTQIITEFETITGIHEDKHNNKSGLHVGYNNHTLIISDTEEKPEPEVKTGFTLSDKIKSELRIKKITYKFNVYKTMLLDYIKRNERIGLYQKGYIDIMDNCFNMIELEQKLYK